MKILPYLIATIYGILMITLAREGMIHFQVNKYETVMIVGYFTYLSIVVFLKLLIKEFNK